MDDQIHIIICFILLLTTLPKSHCQLQPPPQQPLHDYSMCRKAFPLSYSYSCGNLSDVSYPFWGHNRPSYCGGGDPFQLHCHDDQNTTILIGSQNFTVIEIHPETNWMRMKRTDLALDVCSPQFNDTYLIPPLFRYLPTVQNITIFYDCPYYVIDHGYPFFCNNATSHLGPKDEALEAFPELRRCGRHVQVPVPLEPGVVPTGRNVVELVREEGFVVEYSVDQECTRCLGSGHCWNNSTDNDDIEQHVQRSCFYSYCSDGSVTTTQCYAAHENKRIWFKKIILGVMGAASAALFMCFILKFWLTTKNDQNIEAFLKNHRALSQKRYKFSEVKKMTNSFRVKLGQGGFGAVYKGKLPNGGHVAVKILNASKGNGEDFINEVASISRTSHVNVVTLVGFCFEGCKKALIYEFMSNGSLNNFISNKGAETIASLGWETLYQIAKGIARGLEYLHRGCNTRILHFDIKPHNILLDKNFCPKISDFGLAKLCLRKESFVSISDPRDNRVYSTRSVE